jgi:splicing factor 3A subunit 3
MRGDNMFRTFYETIKNTGEYSRRFPDAVNISDIQNQMDIDEVNVQFSGEEVFGKYLDLNNFYIRYCNLPGIPYSRDQDYLQYLDKFNTFFYISENNKTSNEYIKYINDLWEYLLDFFLRIQPLVDMNEFIDTWKNEFDNKWLNGKISGWDIKSAQSRNVAPEPIRLGMFNSAQELEALGLERLKSGLEALGLKCGGTLKDRAERLWSVRGKKPHEIPDKLKKKETSSNGSPNGDIKREVIR